MLISNIFVPTRQNPLFFHNVRPKFDIFIRYNCHLEFRGMFDLSTLLLEVLKVTWAHKQLKFINMASKTVFAIGKFVYILKVNLSNCVT
jgi:hypothetical protein